MLVMTWSVDSNSTISLEDNPVFMAYEALNLIIVDCHVSQAMD